jgi:sugar/nucleoside kinase (ribokinase family)
VANVGQDKNGDMCIESLKKDGVNTEFIRVNKDKNTNYHYVLWFEDERTILQKHSDFPYILPELGNPKWIYLTSLGEKSLPMHEEIVEFLEKNPEVKMAFQPGIFQIKMGYEKLKKIYQKSEIFFCNVDEAKTILEIKEHIEIKDLIRKMHDLGPKIVILTDGMNGAYGSEDGKDVLFIPSFPDPKPPLERTGAGDAFASTVVSAIILGKDLSFALAWGGINAMSVVQDIGAQRGLLSQEKIEEHLKNASETYKAKTL